MDGKELAFLDETEETQETAQPEQAEELKAVEVEAKTAETGAEPVDESTGEKEEVTPPVAEQEAQVSNVPLSAMLDEREKRQKLERELEILRSQQVQQPQQKPDFFEAPEMAVQQEVMRAKASQSQYLAEREYGVDAVREAVQFFSAPQYAALSQQLMNHPSPFHAAVEEMKRQKLVAEIGNNPDDWRKAQEEQIRAQVIAEAQANAQTSKPKVPPPSMARAGSTGGEAQPPGNAFDAMFGDS